MRVNISIATQTMEKLD